MRTDMSTTFGEETKTSSEETIETIDCREPPDNTMSKDDAIGLKSRHVTWALGEKMRAKAAAATLGKEVIMDEHSDDDMPPIQSDSDTDEKDAPRPQYGRLPAGKHAAVALSTMKVGPPQTPAKKPIVFEDQRYQGKVKRKHLSPFPQHSAKYTFSGDHDGCWEVSIVLSRETVAPPQTDACKKQIMERFKDTTYRGAIWPEQPIRGPHGQCNIELKENAKAVKSKAMCFSGDRHLAMKGLAEDWMKKGKMARSAATEWLSMAFPVPKKTPGEWRGVIDYRLVNLETKDDTYPLPRIGDILERQGRRHLWTVIDLKDAFSQIPMHPESMHIIAVGTPIGVLKPLCMPQGLKNAPAVWQRMIEWVMRDVRDIADPYIDDIIIGTAKLPGMSEEDLISQHYQDVMRVLTTLEDHKLVADEDKTTFFARVV
jgi:hypothetical protein